MVLNTQWFLPSWVGRSLSCVQGLGSTLLLVCISECGGVIHKKQGHLVLESYPNNARCEWTIQVDSPFTVELR